MRFLVFFCCLASASLAAEWQQLRDCELVANPANDGDSFHIRHEGKELIIRLGYVDTPETRAHKEFVERTTDQAKYFGVTKTRLFELAAESTALTQKLLQSPFTVWTDGTDARGNSQLPRVFGVVQTSQGEDLGERLVEAGLARVYGYSPNRPDGTAFFQYRDQLKNLEATAFQQKMGAWSGTKRKSPPTRGSSATLIHPQKTTLPTHTYAQTS